MRVLVSFTVDGNNIRRIEADDDHVALPPYVGPVSYSIELLGPFTSLSLLRDLYTHLLPRTSTSRDANTAQSQAIIAGPQIFVSGQIPADKTGALVEGSIADKTKQCCENIKAILAEVNVGIERIVKINVFLDDMANFVEMNEVYMQYFTHKPARSCVAVKQLPKGVPVEIECIAWTGENAGSAKL
jgi:reactive intermediate/imine deaminase